MSDFQVMSAEAHVNLLYFLGNVREFVETEFNNRLAAGGNDSDYCQEAEQALNDIIAAIGLLKGEG